MKPTEKHLSMAREIVDKIISYSAISEAHCGHVSEYPDFQTWRNIVAKALSQVEEETREECARVAKTLCFCRDVNHVAINAPMFCPVAKSYAEAIRRKGGES